MSGRVAATGPGPAALRRRIRIVSRVQAGLISGALYAAALLAGSAAGWSTSTRQAVAAGVLAVALSALLDGAERWNLRRARTAGALVDLPDDLGDTFALGVDGAEDALAELSESLRTAWGLDSVSIEALGTGTSPSRPDRTDASALTVDLQVHDRVAGRLTVTSGDERLLRERVGPVLDRVAGLIGVSVLLSGLNAEVQDMRRRLLRARTEERQLLHRELHDRIAPALAEVASGLRAIASVPVPAEDPSRLGDAVRRMRDQLAQCANDVRTLARALLPSALDEGDLEGALRELTRRRGDVSWHVRAEGTDDLSMQSQLAVYLTVADLVAEAEDAGTHRDIHLDVAVTDEVACLRVTVPGPPLPLGVRGRLRAAVERRAAALAVEVAGLPEQQGIEVRVPR